MFLRSLAKGQPLARGLQDALDDALAKLPIPKVMSYQAPTATTTNQVRAARAFAARAARRRRRAGHARSDSRPVARPPAIASWPPRIADRDRRRLRAAARSRRQGDRPLRRAPRARSSRQLERRAAGATRDQPDALLDEVTALVERPTVYAGTFDRAFLDVPQECLVLTMQQNQKYFALADAEGRLTHRFLLVSNIDARDPAGDHQRQRARAPRAPRRRSLLLRPGPQDAARVAGRRSSRASSTTASSARRATARGAPALPRRATWPADRRAAAHAATARRCSPRPISSATWSANSPSCRE